MADRAADRQHLGEQDFVPGATAKIGGDHVSDGMDGPFDRTLQFAEVGTALFQGRRPFAQEGRTLTIQQGEKFFPRGWPRMDIIRTQLSALPTSLAQAFEHVRMLLRPHPCRALADVDLKGGR